MFDRNRFSIYLLWTLAALFLFTGNAMAYVGPGGMELVGYAISLMAWIVVAMFLVLLWPLYSFLHWLRGRKVPATNSLSTGSVPAESNAQQGTEGEA